MNQHKYLFVVIAIFFLGCGQSADERTPPPKPQVQLGTFDLNASNFCGKSDSASTNLAPANQVDLEAFRAELATEQGATGWVHAAVPDLGYYVFTYRSGSFFNYVDVSLVAPNNDITKKLSLLKRHDKIAVKGVMIENQSPLQHILVENVGMIEAYVGVNHLDRYKHQSNPKDIEDDTRHNFVVHANIGSGAALAVEYGDVVVPLYVDPAYTKQTEKMYRNDIISARVRKQQRPNAPVHLILAPAKGEKPIEIVDRIVNCHGKQKTITGSLVLFPSSPQITRDIYAIQVEDVNGLVRHWTLVNFENQYAFDQIQTKAAQAWNSFRKSRKHGRNYLINQQIRVNATGVMNIISPSQANPQLILDSAKDLSTPKRKAKDEDA
jgi:hypothetical protein